MRVRFTAFLFGLAAVLCLGLMGGYAEEKTTYSVGDSVKVKYVGEVVTGTITSTKISGSIEVEFKWKGKTLSKSFPLTLVEGPGDEPAKPAPVTKPAGTPAKPAAPPKKPAADKPAMKSGTGQRPAPALKPENQPEAKPEATSTNKQEMRTWTDDTGKFTVEASFDGLEDGEVKLLKPDGKTTRIPLDKLSPADRELAEQLAEKQAAKPAPKPGDKNSPFKNSEDSSETAGAGQHEMRTWTSANGKSTFEARYAGYELGVVTLIKADGKKVKLSIHKLQQADQLVAMQLSNEEWHKNQTLSGEMSPKRDPGVPSDQLAGTVQASSQNWVGVRTMPSSAELPVEFHLDPDIAVEKKLEVMEGPFIYASRKAPKAGAQIEFGTRDEVTRLMIDPESNQAIVVLRSQLGAETPVIRVVRIDLKDGKVAAQPFQFAADLRAYHPTTHRFLGNTSWDVNPHDSSLKQHLFGVWTQGEKAFEQLGAWPYELEVKHSSKDLGTLLFAGSDFAVLWCDDKTVKVWNIAGQSPQYVYKTSEYHGAPPTLSPSGKYLALIGEDEQTHVIEVASGKLLGKLPVKGLNRFAFDPQGKYFAAASTDRIVVYDLQVGKLHRDLYMAQRLDSHSSDRNLIWLSEGYLLANSSLLVDIERATVLWRYEMPPMNADSTQTVYYGGEFWYLLKSDDSHQLGLFHAKIPHQAALDAASQIGDNNMVLRPGAKIRLALSLATVSPEEQVKIRQSLTKMIEAREMAVDEASPLVLTVTTAPGAAVQETYKFPNAPDQTATATPIALTATLAENGEAIWRDQSYTGGLPGLMALKTGESAQSYVDANCKPTYQFFHDLAIPPRMAKSPPGGAYGVSVLTKNGIE